MSFDPLLLFLLSFDSLLVELLSLLIELRSSTPLLIELRSSLLVFITAGYCSIITARVFCEILVFGILLQIDSLDTLALLGDRDRFATSIEWIGKNIRFDINKTVSLFETTIRVLGGLLSAHLIVNDYATVKMKDAMIGAVPSYEEPYIKVPRDEEHENKGKDESCEAAESGASEREDATDEI
ncbi:putative alpha-mannosidase I [Arachis hypogaea]|nr:putative alpha-mannosidase I [Arachis hypogaea]